MTRLVALAVLLVAMLTACGAAPEASDPSSSPTSPETPSRQGPGPAAGTPKQPTEPTEPEPTTPPPRGDEEPDPRWQFFADDAGTYASPWFSGRRRLMIDYGCTDAPFYDPSPRCGGAEGFHHGVDVALPCDTPLTAGRPGSVLPRDAPGAPGTAYGDAPVRIRVGDHDVLIGHARAVAVEPGERVEVGQRLALASDSGAPDGCHLHFEVRPAGGDYLDAVDPGGWLALRRSP